MNNAAAPARKPSSRQHGLLPRLLALWWLTAALPLRAEPAAGVAVAGPSQPLDAQVDVIEDPARRLDLAMLLQVPASLWRRPRSVPLDPPAFQTPTGGCACNCAMNNPAPTSTGCWN